MTTNSECLIVEIKAGEWYYVLEDYNAPKNSWDWREHASAYGPFSSEETAWGHLRDYHANPGGLLVSPFEGETPDAVMQRLIERAPANTRNLGF